MNYPSAPASSLWLHFAVNIHSGRSVGFSEEREEAQRLQEWMYMHKQTHGNLSCFSPFRWQLPSLQNWTWGFKVVARL